MQRELQYDWGMFSLIDIDTPIREKKEALYYVYKLQRICFCVADHAAEREFMLLGL